MRAAFPNKILQARYANGYLGVHPWLGYHDDMFPEDTDGGEEWHFLPNLRRAGRDQNWKVACIGGEMVPNQALRWLTTDWSITRTMLERGHFTYLGPYCPPLENHNANATFLQNSRWMVRRMGYEYRLDRLQWTPQVQRGRRIEITLSGENQGVAPFYTNRAFRVHESPPSFRFPSRSGGNRAGRAHSVPPASRGNLKEGVFNCCFCELWLGDWYYYPWQVKMALLNSANQPVLQWQVKADIRRWLPGVFGFTTVSPIITLARGTYRLALGIIDPWRNRPRIRFANNLPVVNGWTVLEQVRVV